jgi:hypothetical protein
MEGIRTLLVTIGLIVFFSDASNFGIATGNRDAGKEFRDGR